MFNLFRPKKQPEIKSASPVDNRDLNLLMLMQNVNESEYRLGKITEEQYLNQCVSLEILGLQLSEKHIKKLEEEINVVSYN